MVFVQDNIHQNNKNHSLKSGKQHIHKTKHKKGEKRSVRYEKQTYPETTKMKVSKTPRCDVRC